MVVGNSVTQVSAEAMLTTKEDSILVNFRCESGNLRVGASHLPNSKIVPEFENMDGSDVADGHPTALYVNRIGSNSLSIWCFRYTLPNL